MSYRTAAGKKPLANQRKLLINGAEGDRTPDLCSAIAALSQLSYSPAHARDWPISLRKRSNPSHRVKTSKPR